MRRSPLVAAVLAIAGATPVRAQDSTSTKGGGVASILVGTWNALRDSSRAGWARPSASLIVPGMGQLMAGNDRGALYLIADALLVTRFIAQQREGRREGDRFRDLALVVARGSFGGGVTDTTFEYYEQMGKFIESGPFDTDPGIAFLPPTDPQTFNGTIWQLARETFFLHPDSIPPPDSEEYQRALEFYRRRAIGPNFRWSWRNAALEQDLFRQAMRLSDEAFRHASQQLGLLLANHLLSAVDALVSHRLSRNGRTTRVNSIIWLPTGTWAEPEWRVGVKVGF